jgi:hypothetical protein
MRVEIGAKRIDVGRIRLSVAGRKFEPDFGHPRPRSEEQPTTILQTGPPGKSNVNGRSDNSRRHLRPV